MKYQTAMRSSMFFLLLIFLTGACNSESGLTSSLGKEKGKNKKEENISTSGESGTPDADSQEDDEGVTADMPVSVSGTFLTCEAESTGTDDYPCQFSYLHETDIEDVEKAMVSIRNEQRIRFSIKPTVVVAGPQATFNLSIPKLVGNIALLVIDFQIDDKRISISTVGAGPGKSSPLINTAILTVAQDSHLMFVSNETFALGSNGTSEFNSLSSADEACESMARLANLPRVGWRPVLSDGEDHVKDERILSVDIYDVAGNLLAYKDDLWTKPLLGSPSLTENGTRLSDNAFAWTGSQTTGVHSGKSCADWRVKMTDTPEIGTVGSVARRDAWLAFKEENCLTTGAGAQIRHHIYCISKKVRSP